MTKTLIAVLLVSLLGLPTAVSASAAPERPAAAPYAVTPFHARASDDDRLERAWKRWQGRDDHARYTVTVTRSCFCPPGLRPVVTEVAGRRVVSVTRRGSDRQLRRRGDEMPRLYRYLRRAYADAFKVEVRYRRGVPTRIVVDRDEMIADEEQYLSVKVTTG